MELLREVPLLTIVTECQADRNLEPPVAIFPTALRKSGHRMKLTWGEVEKALGVGSEGPLERDKRVYILRSSLFWPFLLQAPFPSESE